MRDPTPVGLARSSRPDERGPASWGAWQLIGATGLLCLVAQIIPAGVIVGYALAVRAPGTELDWAALEFSSIGTLASIAGAALTLVLAWRFARRQQSDDPRSYLGLHAVSARVVLSWCGFTVLLMAAQDSLSLLLGRPVVPPVMIEIYTEAVSKGGLLFVVIVLAPIVEETIFRGFLTEGLRRTRLGTIGVIALPAATWAVSHLQYDGYGISMVAAAGVLLGFARLRTGSLVVPMVMHVVHNLLSTIGLLVVVHRGH